MIRFLLLRPSRKQSLDMPGLGRRWSLLIGILRACQFRLLYKLYNLGICRGSWFPNAGICKHSPGQVLPAKLAALAALASGASYRLDQTVLLTTFCILSLIAILQHQLLP